jgi:hypothetical protein
MKPDTDYEVWKAELERKARKRSDYSTGQTTSGWWLVMPAVALVLLAVHFLTGWF